MNIRFTLRTVLIAAIVLILPLMMVTAEDREPLELDADLAVELALQRNLNIRTQEIELMIAERNYSDRWNVFLPQISARSTLARPNVEPEATPDLQGTLQGLEEFQLTDDPTALDVDEPDDPPRWNLSTNLDISLTLTRQMLVGLEQRTQSLDDAEFDLRQARRETERDVRLSFYELLLQQEQIALSERRLEEAEQRYEEAQQDFEDGIIDEFTLLSTQVALENQRPALRRQRQAYDAAIRQFALTLGVPPEEELELTGDIGIETVELESERELRARIGRSADIREARRSIDQIELARDATVSQMFPTLTFGYNIDPALEGDPFSSDVFDLDQWEQRSGAFSITLNVPIDPLLPRSSTRTELAEQERQREQAEVAVEQAIDGVESRLLTLLETIEITREAMESVMFSVEVAERALELAEEGYDAGLRDISDVRDAEIDLLDAQLDLLQEQFDYREALVNLEFLLDTPVSELTDTQ